MRGIFAQSSRKQDLRGQLACECVLGSTKPKPEGSKAGREEGCIHVVHYQAGHSSAADTAGSTVTIDAAQSPFISNQPLEKKGSNSVAAISCPSSVKVCPLGMKCQHFLAVSPGRWRSQSLCRSSLVCTPAVSLYFLVGSMQRKTLLGGSDGSALSNCD